MKLYHIPHFFVIIGISDNHFVNKLVRIGIHVTIDQVDHVFGLSYGRNVRIFEFFVDNFLDFVAKFDRNDDGIVNRAVITPDFGRNSRNYSVKNERTFDFLQFVSQSCMAMSLEVLQNEPQMREFIPPNVLDLRSDRVFFLFKLGRGEQEGQKRLLRLVSGHFAAHAFNEFFLEELVNLPFAHQPGVPFHSLLLVKKGEMELSYAQKTVKVTYVQEELAVAYIPVALDEKQAVLLEQDLLERDPELKKGEAKFYARHCTKGKKYTIAQYKKSLRCAYETARTSMDHLAELLYYRKEKIKNKYVYIPVERE